MPVQNQVHIAWGEFSGGNVCVLAAILIGVPLKLAAILIGGHDWWPF